MEIILSIVGLVILVSLYDFFAARTWQQVTSVQRNNLVFQKRNKEYGAYVIRRDYDKRMIIIIGSVILAIGLVYAGIQIVKGLPEPEEEEIPMDLSQFTVAAPPVEEVEPPPVEEEIPPTEQTIEFLPPVVVDREVETTPPIQESFEEASSSTQTQDAEPTFNEIPEKPVAKPVENIPEETHTDVDEPAEYPGGRAAMLAFLRDNMKYPETAVQAGLEGKCYLRFIVGTDGKITDVRVLRGVPDCPECDNEAKRVVKQMPKWKPGMIGGRGVRSYFDLPVNFTLN